MAEPTNPAICHCIIGHPTKPKFLAIKHSEGWQPPTLKFPSGMLDYKASNINEAMMIKYGLKTRVVRVLQNWPNYNCIELELPERTGTRKIEAVWVDRERYLQFRSGWAANKDPIEQWLLERERAETHPLRPPWAVPGWFNTADHWIHFQLDWLNLQATGSVQQYRVGWNASCLLSVPTSAGTIFFKAGYAKPPGEVRLTLALAKKWPDAVVAPLASDANRNWMLNRDFRVEGSMFPGESSLPDFARVMARIQLESAGSLPEWEKLGCPRQGLDHDLKSIADGYFLPDFLRQGQSALTDAEWLQLQPALQACAHRIRQLQAFDIPDMLVHLDFRDDNLVMQDGRNCIIDWSDVIIGHPFRVLQKVHEQSIPAEAGRRIRSRLVDQHVLNATTRAYLDAFRPHGSADDLDRAMGLARSLFPLWRLASLRYEYDWAEPDSPRQVDLVAHLQNAARRLLVAEADGPA